MPKTADRNQLTRPGDVEAAAEALARGAVVAHGFANSYAITTRADRATVRRVNALKGRPPEQVGSITAPPSRVADAFDWTALPPGFTRRSVLGVIDTFFGMGPFGFRGPAAGHIPAHLTFPDEGVTTAQVIAPGYACASNEFLVRALEATDHDLLYITSANRSRHATGADDTPAHCRADALRAEFGHDPDFLLLPHADEAAARGRYPAYEPMSTSVLSFHTAAGDLGDPRPHFVLERHGSLRVEHVRAALDRLGFGLSIGPRARVRLHPREYS